MSLLKLKLNLAYDLGKMAGPWNNSFLTDFADAQALDECGGTAQQGVQDPGGHGPSTGGHNVEDRLSARRMHKADREKLRRDKLNEEFSELANALDPDRPKNDKATILRESIQVVKDLREEVKRLKVVHASLLDESGDLIQEKNELREEKVALKNETEGLQSQLQQRLRTFSPWMALDPSMVMSIASAYPYPMPIPQPVSLPQSDSHQVGGPRIPLVSPTPCMPIAPPMGTFQMHPTLQPYAMFGNRAGDSGNPYMPYPTFPPPVNSHSHVERPNAQYPSSVQQPVPGYVVQISPSQDSQMPPSSHSPVYKPCVPGIPVIPAQNHASSKISKDSSDHPSPTSQSSSHHALAESEQGNTGIVAAQVSQSPVAQDTTEVAAQDPDVKDKDLELHEGNIPSPASIVSSTFCVKEKLSFSLDRSGLSLVTEGHGKDCSQAELENVHDPTLRPPAA